MALTWLKIYKRTAFATQCAMACLMFTLILVSLVSPWVQALLNIPHVGHIVVSLSPIYNVSSYGEFWTDPRSLELRNQTILQLNRLQYIALTVEIITIVLTAAAGAVTFYEWATVESETARTKINRIGYSTKGTCGYFFTLLIWWALFLSFLTRTRNTLNSLTKNMSPQPQGTSLLETMSQRNPKFHFHPSVRMPLGTRRRSRRSMSADDFYSAIELSGELIQRVPEHEAELKQESNPAVGSLQMRVSVPASDETNQTINTEPVSSPGPSVFPAAQKPSAEDVAPKGTRQFKLMMSLLSLATFNWAAVIVIGELSKQELWRKEERQKQEERQGETIPGLGVTHTDSLIIRPEDMF